MKQITTLFALCILNLSYSQGDPSWVNKKSPGSDLTARADAGMVSYNNQLYILGGTDGCGPKKLVQYDPADGMINQLENLGLGCANPITDGVMFSIADKIYSFSSVGTNVYDIITDQWAYYPLASGLLPDTGFLIDNIIYVTSKSNNNFYAFDTQTNIFTQKANYPGDPNRRGAISFDINGKGYFGGGSVAGTNGCTTEQGCFLNTFYEYDPIMDSWTSKAGIPKSIMFGAAISHNGKGYAGLGEIYVSAIAQRVKSAFWYKYDPVLDSWTAMQNFMDVDDNNYYSTISESAIAKIGDDIYVFGGRSEGTFNNYQDDIYKYSISDNTWSLLDADPGKNRTEATGFFLNDKIYVGGGHNGEGLFDFWEYDIATDVWLQKTDLPSTHTQRACVPLNGKGYFLGGYGKSVPVTTPNPNANYLETFLEYDPVADTFTEKAPFPMKISGAVSMVYNGKIYAGIGNNFNNGPTNVFYEYDPQTNSWTAKAPAPFTGANLSHFVIGDVGYVVAYNPIAQVGKYNFLTDTWTTEIHTLDNFNSAEYAGQAFVFDGEAYIVHGAYNDGDHLSKYNPATSTWSAVLNLPFKHGSQTIIATNDEIYFGFGEAGVNGAFGSLNAISWQSLRFGAEVSDKTGLYATTVSNIYLDPIICGTGNLQYGAKHSISDANGDLFMSIESDTTIFPSFCMEVNSTGLIEDFQTASGNFGNGFTEDAMYMSKDLLIKNNNTIGEGGIVKLYFTHEELEKLVADFNTTYNLSKTIADIQILKYFEYNSNDHDIQNNNIVSGFALLDGTLHNYGTDYYFEINGSSTNAIIGEIRAVLLTGENLGTIDLKASRFIVYPNPVASLLNVQSPEHARIDKIIVMDLAGKQLLQKPNASQVNIDALAKGMYIIEIHTEGYKFQKKFIKN